MSLKNIAGSLADYLRFEIEEGVETVELTERTARELRAAPGAPRPAAARPRGAPAEAAAAPSARRAPEGDAPADDGAGAGLVRIAGEVAACRRCALHEKRTRTVPGQGRLRPDVMFIGEGPGEDEDRTGLAFVGAAGQLLTKMIEAMGYRREDVFIGNIVKCRPPGNRKPLPEEMEACLPYLRAQIALLKPKVIVALGAVAAKGLLDPNLSITAIRGTWRRFEGIDVMPTFHPAYLLRNEGGKKFVWADLKAVLQRLGRQPPPVMPGGGRRAAGALDSGTPP